MESKSILAILFVCLSATAEGLNCIQCDSKDNKDCVANIPNLPTNSVCIQDNSLCFSKVNLTEGTVERGCLDFTELENCMTDEYCSFCNNEEQCNNGIFPRNRLKCVICEDCHENATLPQPQVCDKYFTDDSCFTNTDPKTMKTSRGCGSQGVPVCGDCLYETCKGDGCNKDIPEIPNFTCYECVGSDENCIRGLEDIEKVRCTHGAQCLVKYDAESKKVERRCIASNDETCNDEFCKVCKGQDCNGGTFPEDRLSCLQCTSENNTDDCYNGTATSNTCLSYDRFDRCYSFVDHNGQIHRGCETDKYCQSSDKCYFCGTNSCNTINKPDELKPSQFECFKCLGVDAACLLGTTQKEVCQNGNSCIMKVTDDKKIERRCISNEEEKCEAGSNCVLCDGNQCNGGVFPKDKVELFYMVMIKV